MKKMIVVAVLAAAMACVTGCQKEEQPGAEQAKKDVAAAQADFAKTADKTTADMKKAAVDAKDAAGKTVDGAKKALGNLTK